MNQQNDGGDGNADASPHRHGKAPAVHTRWPQIEAEGSQRQQKGYFSKPKNWVALATLFFVFVYTAISVLIWCNSLESNRIARESFTAVQRAFVTVASFDTPVRFGVGFASETKYWFIIPNIKNSGNTPTKNMRYFIAATCPAELDIGLGANMSIDCDFTRPPEPIDPDDLLKRPNFKDKTSAAILGPQTAIPLTGIGITEKSVRAIREGFPLFVWGIVYYNDIFPKSQLRVTKFCYRVGVSISDKKEIAFSYAFCKHWNCADDECKTDREAYNAEIANPALAPKQTAPIPSQPALK